MLQCLHLGRIIRLEIRAMSSMPSYENWSKEDLIARLRVLEGQQETIESKVPLSEQSGKFSESAPKEFDFSSYPRRKIALKFCYSGWEYNGLAFQTSPTPLPTVESVLFDALARTKLIDPAAGYDGCEWEKCGRTDRGVSAAGQVISLWVRSALDSEPESSKEEFVVQKTKAPSSVELLEDEPAMLEDGFGSLSLDDEDISPPPTTCPVKKSRPEHAYVTILNRILPPTIRVLAWSPVVPTFSARFACKYRHYKYFFSSEHLDIPRMQDAASRLLGEHDFRNLCKLDAAKQITVFQRKILRAEIVPVDDDASSTMYVLNLVGTAFLYHQVRHIMAVLFLVGRGLEQPSVINSLLNAAEGLEQLRDGETLEVVDSKPEYQMADALPLMLWDCGYSDQDVSWRTDGFDPNDRPNSTEDGRGIYHLLHSIHARSEIYSVLNQHFLNAAAAFFSPPWAPTPEGPVGIRSGNSVTVEVPLGGGSSRKLQIYVPLLKRKRLDPVEVVNERWRNGKGFRREQKKKNDEDGSGDVGDDGE